MRQVDYDTIAGQYPRRYQLHDYAGIERALTEFVAGSHSSHLLEVGCGTGHWLALLSSRVPTTVGIDPSRMMLQQARRAAPAAHLVEARAEDLPLQDGAVDRVICVNALHHFSNPAAFFREARRLLRPDGGLLTVGLDPHVGQDQWWIYDYFPEALLADRARYLPVARIRQLLAAAGFRDAATREVQHMPAAVPVQVALEHGLLERSSTSQLMVISDEAYRAGLERVRAARPAPGDTEPLLRADLRLYATIGWSPTETLAAGT